MKTRDMAMTTYPVPLLDLRAQNEPIKNDIIKAIEQVYDSGQFIMGPWVQKFEHEIAEYLGVEHAIGVSSGTDALLVSLMALGIGHGDTVITTAFSFFATAGVIARAGAKPVFADIEPHSYNICPESLRQTIANALEKGEAVKAIIPVHLYGQCANMNEIMSIARHYGLKVIEDAAQAIGSRCPFEGKVLNAGTIGDCGCFSFFPGKNLGCLGDGGLVVTRDSTLAEKIRLLRTHGARPKYYHAEIGGNFRLDALQAAVLSVKLAHLERWHGMRIANAQRYRELFSKTGLVDAGYVQLPVEVYPGIKNGHIYNQFVLRVKHRDQLKEYLTGNQIGNEVYYPVPFHLQQCFRQLGYARGDLPVAEAAAGEVIAIPVYPELALQQQERVVNVINDFYNNRKRIILDE
ncbi:DegT/DnrJ/EryC1/StrS aminotransferase family protein [Desulfallas sp. Bu1-1]|uniref:DegT/DnrJ/EryC1/StrS family aminotransferase n=1 Tax=Desulfallas sp. Bu1-1 TaxID=2787620 RepID=UPI001FADC3D7|nr:DegT/DnrJ/EryC1/StrS family aminotransferase [Desulfallas sp. Bu1-1]